MRLASTRAVRPSPAWAYSGYLLSLAGIGISAVDGGVEISQTRTSASRSKKPLPGLSGLFAARSNSDDVELIAQSVEANRWFGLWAMFADKGRHQEALWRFLSAVASRPRMDDEQARQHFGLSLAELDAQVGEFRQQTQAHWTVRFDLPPAPVVAAAVVRDATEEEIACALTQWILETWRRQPELQVPLRDAARRAIKRATKDQKEEPPRVSAMHGLIELRDGNVTGGRALLESAAATGDALNSGARFELAKLRYADALAQPAAPSGRFDAAQVSAILAPLAPALAEPPPSADVLKLILHTWQRAQERLSHDELVHFVAGVRLFPEADELMVQTAQLCFEQGLEREALELAALGLDVARTEKARTTFLELNERFSPRAGK